MTPYLMKVQDTVHAEDQFCCLLLAERVHSGYDGKNLAAASIPQFSDHNVEQRKIFYIVKVCDIEVGNMCSSRIKKHKDDY